MKKSSSLVLCSFIVIGLFATAFAIAESGSDKNETELESESELEIEIEDDKVSIEQKTRVGGIKEEIRAEIKNALIQERDRRIAELKLRLKERNGTIEIDKMKVRIEGLDEEQKEIIVGRINAKTGLNLTVEDLENGTRGEILRAYLSNGAKADIKVLPDRAADIALERLKARCEERNCSVELKEVGEGNRTRAVYVVETEKEARTLLIFKNKMKVRAEVDAETGEIVSVKRPWWSFLAAEKDADAEVETEVEVNANTSLNSS